MEQEEQHGMNLLRKKLRENNVNQNIVGLGRGTKGIISKDGRNKRYKLNITKKDGLKYAIQYCEDIRQFVIWDIEKYGFKSPFSVIANDVIDIRADGIRRVAKYKWFRGNGEEIVLTIDENEIDGFIKDYLL